MSLISYKMKSKSNPILTRFKIIKAHFVKGLNKSKIARKFWSHRNTIWNIIFIFEKNAQADTWDILYKNKLSNDEIYKHFSRISSIFHHNIIRNSVNRCCDLFLFWSRREKTTVEEY